MAYHMGSMPEAPLIGTRGAASYKPVVTLSVKVDKFNLGSFQNCLKKTSISYRISSWFSFDIDPT